MGKERELMQENKELQRLNQQLKEKIEDTEKRVSTKSYFFSQVGKEFLGPIQVLHGLANKAKDLVSNNDDTEEKRELVIGLLNSIEDCSHTLLGLHDCLWDSAIIENGMMKFDEERFDLEALIEELIEGNRIAMEQRFLDVYVNLDGVKEKHLIGDKYKLMKILEAVFAQAKRCASYSSAVNLYVQQVIINSKKLNLEFVLRYSGKRLVRDFYERFIPGFEINGVTLTPGVKSSIIQYTVCKYFLDMMDGEINIDTQTEDEISLIFDIPMEYPSERDDTETQHFAKINALVLSDSKTAREEDVALLRRMGIRCEDAPVEEDTLDMIGMAEEKNAPYNLIIIDDEIEDEEVLKFVREIRNIFGTAIHIAASAANVDANRRRAEAAGLDHLLPKGTFQKELYQLLLDFEDKTDETDSAPEETYSFENKWVLVAEDIPLNMEVVVKLLKRVNISVVCAENGLEALHFFESKPADFFDCILMDIHMPVMDGIEATKRIRASHKEDGQTVPIYAMTANALPKDIEAVLSAGMTGHLAKPVNVSALYRVLEKIFTDREANAMDETLRKRAEELMQENDLLRNRAERDPMTQLLNRYAFEKLIAELKTEKAPLGFMLLDVDKFKTVNDTYGHGIGDRVLIQVADMLRHNFRSSDYMVRFGGDEFAVIFREFDPVQTQFVANKIEQINLQMLQPKGDLPPVSLSAGVVFSMAGYTDDLYQKADKALYETKKQGRCGCTVYADTLE